MVERPEVEDDQDQQADSRNGGAAEHVWREVLRGLYEGRFQAGQRLTEADLTRDLGVSRSSAREGLSRLAAEGIVTIVRHKGAIVRVLTKDEHLETLAVLDALIGLAARLAAAGVEKPGNREMAETLLQRLAAPRSDLSAYDLARESNHFYRTLVQLAGNSELRRLLRQVHFQSVRLELVDRRSNVVVIAEYIGIVAAILAADPSRAEQAAKDHIARNIADIERASQAA